MIPTIVLARPQFVAEGSPGYAVHLSGWLRLEASVLQLQHQVFDAFCR